MLIRKEIILKSFFALLIIIISLCHIKLCMGTTYGFADEVGYWGTAASIVGYDWSGIMSNISYYSFVYSILLIPIMKIGVAPILTYQIAIVFNVIMLVTIFLISCKVIEKILKNVSRDMIIVTCFAATMYSGYIYYSQNTSGEILNLLLYWLVILALIRYIRVQSIGNMIILIAITVLNFAAHMRSLSILFATIITLTTLNFSKKRIKYLVVSIICFIPFVAGFIVMKEYVQNKFYSQNSLLVYNDISGQTSKISYLFSVEGIINIINMMLGRVFYLLNSSYFLIGLGIFACLLCVYSKVKNDKEYFFDKKYWNVATYMLVCLLFSIGISAAYFQNPGNHIHYLFYGRYTEYIIMPFIILGILSFTKMVRNKVYISLIIGDLILCKYIYWYMVDKEINIDSIHPNTPGNAGFLTALGNISQQEKATFITTMIAILIFIISITISKKISNIVVRIFSISLLAASMWIISANMYISAGVHSEEVLLLHKEYQETAKIIKENISEGQVIFVNDGNWKVAKMSHYLQFKMPDIKLEYVEVDIRDIEKILKYKEEFLILGKHVDYDEIFKDTIEKKYAIVYSNSQLMLLKNKEHISF